METLRRITSDSAIPMTQIVLKYRKIRSFSIMRIVIIINQKKGETLGHKTIIDVAVVDVAVSKRSVGGGVAAHANGHDLADLGEIVVELRIGHVEIQISDVEGTHSAEIHSVRSHRSVSRRRRG